MNLRALGDTGAVLRAYAFSTVCDKFMHLPPPSNHWWFEYLTEGGATAPVGRADSYSRANARRCSPNRNHSQVGPRFRKKGPPLPVASASARTTAAPGQFGRHTRHRIAATRWACLSLSLEAPVAQEHAGRDRGRGHAAFGSSVEAGSCGQSSEIGFLSSHLRKAATAVAVNRSRPLSALANVCLVKPSASAKRDCVPRFRARTPRSSNRS